MRTETPQPVLGLAEAISLLPDSHRLHVWKNDGLQVLSRHLSRDQVIDLMQRHSVRRAKSAAAMLNHGLVVEWRGVMLFIETRGEP